MRRLQRPTELRRHAEIERDRLGVADVQVAVGFGRKPCQDATDPAGREVILDDVPDEMVGTLMFGVPG